MNHSAAALQKATAKTLAFACADDSIPIPRRLTATDGADQAHQIVSALGLPVEQQHLDDLRLAVADLLLAGVPQVALRQSLQRAVAPLVDYAGDLERRLDAMVP